MVVDRRLMDTYLAELDRWVRLLEEERGRSVAELEADPVRAYGVQHLLQICIETLVNCANHLSSECGLRVPRNQAESFRNLQAAGAVDAETADTLVQMARFRNLVVHRYWQVDLRRVHAILQDHLEDFRSAARQIHEFVDKQ
ncbi:MAG: DUF86 domain-containing protein [Candidatus Eremiobacterota bacterium]